MADIDSPTCGICTWCCNLHRMDTLHRKLRKKLIQAHRMFS